MTVTNDSPKTNTEYMCFTGDVPEDVATRKFVDRFNRDPDEVLLDKGILYLGPIPDKSEPEPSLKDLPLFSV